MYLFFSCCYYYYYSSYNYLLILLLSLMSLLIRTYIHTHVYACIHTIKFTQAYQIINRYVYIMYIVLSIAFLCLRVFFLVCIFLFMIQIVIIGMVLPSSFQPLALSLLFEESSFFLFYSVFFFIWNNVVTKLINELSQSIFSSLFLLS